ncbi:WD40-repeat-containing domain protein [Lactarius quietus]|nr:WD40-repeat-containing domain protein [Lactarius quietus]
MALDPHGAILAVGSLDGLVSIWDVNSGTTLHCFSARTPILSLTWSSGPRGFIFGCENGILVSVLLEKAFIRSTYFHAHSRPIHRISPSPNETRLISGAVDEVVVWKRDFVSTTHEELWGMFKPIPRPPDKYSQSGGAVQVTSVNWLCRCDSEEKHKFVVSSYLCHGILCWDLVSLAVVRRLPNPDCSSLALAPDGSLAVVSSSSHAFEVQNIASLASYK